MSTCVFLSEQQPTKEWSFHCCSPEKKMVKVREGNFCKRNCRKSRRLHIYLVAGWPSTFHWNILSMDSTQKAANFWGHERLPCCNLLCWCGHQQLWAIHKGIRDVVRSSQIKKKSTPNRGWHRCIMRCSCDVQKKTQMFVYGKSVSEVLRSWRCFQMFTAQNLGYKRTTALVIFFALRSSSSEDQ